MTGLKQGLAKHQCFMCLWEGRKKELHYTDHQWPARVTFHLGENCVDYEPLVPMSKIILPPLHIKLGLISNFVKALDRDNDAYKHLQTIFPRLSAAKINAGI